MTTTLKKFSYQPQKMEELLLYVADASKDDPSFGKTKLNKILYFIDFYAYGQLGSPVTGATYQHRPFGPVPQEIVSARAALIWNGAAEVVGQDRFGYAQHRLVPSRKSDISVFSSAEVSLIDDVLAALRDKSGVEVSEMSHQEIGWRITSDAEVIPYESVFISNRPLTADDIRRGQEIYKIIQNETVTV